MSLDNYGGLQSEIADWLNRADLTNQIPTFIRTLEARANRVLRTHDMVKRATALTTDGYFSVPSDWKETISLMLTSGRPEPLEFVSVEKSFEKRRALYGSTCDPRFFTQMDGKFFLIPAPAAAIEMELVYRGAIPALTDENPSNWLLTKHPDLYLAGSLVAAEAYLKNDDRLPIWKLQADQAIAEMQAEADRASFPQGKLTAKARTFG